MYVYSKIKNGAHYVIKSLHNKTYCEKWDAVVFKQILISRSERFVYLFCV